MSPNEQKITSGPGGDLQRLVDDLQRASRRPGSPGPWIISISSGSSWSMPCRMIECVWPPQTSMIAHGRVVAAWISSSSLRGQLGVAELVEVLHRAAPRRAVRGCRSCRRRPCRGTPACLAASANPSPNSSSSTPSCSKFASVAVRRLLVEPLQREPDVHDDVLADLDVRDVLQAHLLARRRRSRPRPSACRRVLETRSPCRVRLGTWALSFLASACRRCRRSTAGPAPGRRRSAARAGGAAP